MIALQKLTNCCVAAIVSLIRRTYLRVIAQQLHALPLVFFA